MCAVECGCARSGGLVFAEVEGSRRGVVVALQKIVADAANVGACLQRVVAENLGPVVGKVDIRFGAQPRQRLRVADQRVAGAVLSVACEVADLEGDLSAAGRRVVGAVGTVAGDAERLGIVACRSRSAVRSCAGGPHRHALR